MHRILSTAETFRSRSWDVTNKYEKTIKFASVLLDRCRDSVVAFVSTEKWDYPGPCRPTRKNSPGPWPRFCPWPAWSASVGWTTFSSIWRPPDRRLTPRWFASGAVRCWPTAWWLLRRSTGITTGVYYDDFGFIRMVFFFCSIRYTRYTNLKRRGAKRCIKQINVQGYRTR